MNGLGSIGSLGALSTQATQGLKGSTWTPDNISDLTAWWKVNEGAGLVVGDSKDSYHGDVFGMTEAAFWANTAPDGSPIGTWDNIAWHDVRNITLPVLGANNSVFTTIFAAYHDSTAAGGTTYMHIGNATTAWVLTIDDANGGLDMRFFFKEAGGTYLNFQTSNNDHPDNTWEIWAVGHKYGDSTKTFMYKNGQPISASWDGDGSLLPANTSGVTYLGCRAPGGMTHKGYIGDILYYTKLLDGAEILLLYNYLKGRYGL